MSNLNTEFYNLSETIKHIAEKSSINFKEQNKMEKLNREKQKITASFELDSETKIDYVGVPLSTVRNVSNNKTLSDFDKGIHITAAKILVNGQPIVADDLYECFSDAEVMKIFNFIKEVEGTEKNG